MSSISKAHEALAQVVKGKTALDLDDDVKIKCILMKVNSIPPAELSINNLDASIFMVGLYELMQISTDPKVLMTAAEIVKIALENKETKIYFQKKLVFLPILTEILIHASKKNEKKILLHIIQELTDGNRSVNEREYLRKLISNLVDTVMADDRELGKCALTVLINICQNNTYAQKEFKEVVQLVEFLKAISIEKFGVLSCKMSMVVSGVFHTLNDCEMRNFLSYVSNEALAAVQSRDLVSIKQINSFINAVFENQQLTKVLLGHDFYPMADSLLTFVTKAIETEKSVNGNSRDEDDIDQKEPLQIIFELFNTILKTKNNSLERHLVSLINAGIKCFNTDELDELSLQAVELIRNVLNFDDETEKITSSEFDMSKLKRDLRAILSTPTENTKITIAVLNLLRVLYDTYNETILDESTVDLILGPIFKMPKIKYTDLKKDNVTMYLTTMVTMSRVMKANKPMEVMRNKQAQYLIGMSLKFGNRAQVKLGLDLSRHAMVSTSYISEVITGEMSEESDVENEDDSITAQMNQHQNQTTMLANTVNFGKTSEENVQKTIDLINGAFADNNLSQINLSDFIKIYKAKIHILEQKEVALNQKITDLKKELTNTVKCEVVNKNLVEHLTEVAESLQSANEMLREDVEEKKKSIASTKNLMSLTVKNKEELKGHLKKQQEKCSNLEVEVKKLQSAKVALEARAAEQTDQMADLRTKLKEKIKAIDDLEAEIKDQEDIRNTVMHLVSKRKK